MQPFTSQKEYVSQKSSTENIYDSKNSKIVVACYHTKKWGNGQNATYHAMKFAQESKEYPANPVAVELGRIVRIVKTKSENFKNNPINCLVCYKNSNMGRTLPNIENEQLFKIIIKNGEITHYEINHPEEYWKNFIMSILYQINDNLQ